MEFREGLLGTAGLLLAVIYSMLQWFGGRDQNYLGIRARIWGRVIAPVFFGIAVSILALFSGKAAWLHFLAPISYMVATTLGYGGNSLITKILRRSLWAVVRVSASLVFAIPAGAWTLFVLQLFFALAAALVLGTRNPVKAPQEEGLINFSAAFLVPFMVL